MHTNSLTQAIMSVIFFITSICVKFYKLVVVILIIAMYIIWCISFIVSVLSIIMFLTFANIIIVSIIIIHSRDGHFTSTNA